MKRNKKLLISYSLIGDIMKKSYKRLAIFAIIFILLFLLNSFAFSYTLLTLPTLRSL